MSKDSSSKSTDDRIENALDRMMKTIAKIILPIGISLMVVGFMVGGPMGFSGAGNIIVVAGLFALALSAPLMIAICVLLCVTMINDYRRERASNG